jgi:hypothetical protein
MKEYVLRENIKRYTKMLAQVVLEWWDLQLIVFSLGFYIFLFWKFFKYEKIILNLTLSISLK